MTTYFRDIAAEAVAWSIVDLAKDKGVVSDEALFETDEARWRAVNERLPEADNRFFYGVTTTGIYCRPTCASRQPRRENVRFFDDAAQAEAAGFRPCKRCAPERDAVDPGLAAVIEACRLIDEVERAPSLDELAGAAGFSKYHFQRLFKRHIGLTPRQYAAQKRAERLRAALQEESAVTEAMLDAGFSSSSRLYEAAGDALGMKPKTYLQGGTGMEIRYAIVPSYLGWVLVAATEQGICRIDLDDDPEALRARLAESLPEATLIAGEETFAWYVQRVIAFLERPQQGLDLPLDIQGTAFQRRVWAALQTIPAGSTVSYGELAKAIGQPSAARAVASACAANHIAVAIPCHRVVRGDGGLGGFRWGVPRTAALLAREAE
ncbi:MAG: bifunctional DNA-binding transcriptional regulator/O6-methylguanine-DNA methyltransferase Ada [Candidatus Promineifilaceae bacterium]